MKHYIGCDAHKKYSVFGGMTEAGEIIPTRRVEHDREGYWSFLKGLPQGSQIASPVGAWQSDEVVARAKPVGIS
jgi:hypothetical protein